MTYVVHFTDLGRAFALAKPGGLGAVEARVRAELEAEEVDITKPFMMAVTLISGARFGEEGAPEILICVDDGSGGVLVDSAHWEEAPALARGPFAGKRIWYPVADSEATEGG